MPRHPLHQTPGWAVLHLFHRLNRSRWRALPEADRSAAAGEMDELLGRLSGEEGMQIVPIAGIAKHDLSIMAVHPDAQRIQRLGQEIAATTLGSCLDPVYSFLSISEASEYMSTPGEWAQRLIDEQEMDPAGEEFVSNVKGFAKRMEQYAEARVHPKLPRDMPVVCFYPMSKARGDARNWYTLDFEQRKKLMAQHGESGRRFAGRILQLITSCTGLDDWEWGVTLFGRDLNSVRDVVYEMRFDPASALYAEFGAFYVGLRFAPGETAEVLQL